MKKTDTRKESPLHFAIVAFLLIAGAAASAGPFAQLAKDGFLAAYPDWFAESLPYAVVLGIIGLLMQRRVEKFDLVLVSGAFTAPVFIGMLNSMNSIASHSGRPQRTLTEQAPTMHAMIFYIVIAIIFAKGITAFVARLKARRLSPK